MEHPVKITDHVVAVSPYSAALAVKQDGSLWGWGSDSNGQLGQGSTTWSAVPIHIMDGVKLPEGTEEAPRSDTPSSKNVLAANALGIINGVGNNRFDPNGTFTRAQIAAILNRTAEVLGVETDGYTHTFTDVSGHWVSDSLGWPVHAGIINGVGDNRFDPDGVLTTEQSIVMAQRALKALPISQ